METVSIPYQFIRERLVLTWTDVAWGFQNGWLQADAVVTYAVEKLAEGDEADAAEVELAGLMPAELARVPALLDEVVKSKGADYSTAKANWLYLVLAWVFENRNDSDDPLGLVEEIYADFNYPSEIRNFVRYMPPEDGYEAKAHAHKENLNRLFREWESYLDSFGGRGKS